jgi:hypothetical protein
MIAVEDSCGCTLTRASIHAMTEADFENQFWLETGMSRVVANWKEARMTGVSQKTLTDLFLSRMTPVKKVNLGQSPQQSVIAPFILVPGQHRVNSNYFEVLSGNVHPSAGVPPIPASAWQVTLRNETSQFSTPLDALYRYFLTGRYLMVLYRDATNTGRAIHFRIISSVDASVPGEQRALVSVVPNVTDAAWVGLSPAEKALFQVTHGVVVPLANSVSNYESWCEQDPVQNTWKLKDYWLQTIRETHCYSDAYLEAIAAPLTDPLFKKFRLMPITKQRKIKAAQAERAFWNTVMFGTRINENQTVNTYADLEAIPDPADPECLLEYKANTIGIATQLAECGRVIDFQNAPLNLDTLKTALYSLRRTRSAAGANITRIDAMTDRFTAHNILTLMIRYYKDQYGFDVNRFYQPNQKLTFQDQVLWNYNVYEFPDEGVELCVITDDYFDDFHAAVPTADKSIGRQLMMIDWSDPEVGLAGAESAQRQTNIYDELYHCVITIPKQHYQLWSQTICVQVPDPNRHLIYGNFSDECPQITVNPCVPYEPYEYEYEGGGGEEPR